MRKPASLEERTIGLVSLKKRTGEAVTDSACLTGDTAALNVADDIELTLGAGNGEGLIDDELESFETEILVNVCGSLIVIAPVPGYRCERGQQSSFFCRCRRSTALRLRKKLPF